MTARHIRAAIDAAEPAVEVWPDPDTSFLADARRPAPPLPVEVFGPAGNWIVAAAEGSASPPDYVAVALLAASSALIGNARWVSPWPGWTEPPIIWAALVGPPSHSKSPAMDPVLTAIHAIEADMACQFPETQRLYETRREAAFVARKNWEADLAEAIKKGILPPILPEAAVEPDEPACPRLVAQDVTVERLCDLIAANPKGLLSCRDELAGWLGSFDRYTGSGADRGFWIEAYGGRPYMVDRKKHKTSTRIPRLSIAVLGGIQPDRLNNLLLKGDDDGLPARFLMVWPAPVAPYRPTQLASPSEVLSALRRLHGLAMGSDDNGRATPTVLRLSIEAAGVFEEWRLEHARESPSGGKLASHFGKLPGLTLRLALILEMLHFVFSSRQTEPKEVGRAALLGALRFVDDYVIPMAERIYGEASLPDADRLGRTLARWVIKNKPEVINTRVLLRSVHLPELNSTEKIRMAVNRLAEAEWLWPAADPTGGRPRNDYRVNPRVYRVLP